MLLMLLLFAVLNVLITWLVRKILAKGVLSGIRDVVGFNFTAISGFYALLLAFVVSQALGESNDAQKDADQEGSLATVLYRQIAFFPDTAEVSLIRTQYLKYIKLVVWDEYPLMKKMQKSETTQRNFAKLFELIEQMNPPAGNAQLKAQLLLKTANELAIYRNQRLYEARAEIPRIIWLTLLLGWFITSVLSSMLNVENQNYHFTMSAMMGAFVGLLFFLIIILDHPFAGSIRTEPCGYQSILQLQNNNSSKSP